jgi:hypothetical protein
MGHTVNTLNRILQERAAFANRAAWRAHVAQQRLAARRPATVAIPAAVAFTPPEVAMVARLNRNCTSRGDLLLILGREERYGYLADAEVAESARHKLIAAWEGR